MKVHFHCDDLGATEGMSRDILGAWKEGLLDGFSVFANGDALPEVTRTLTAEADRPARISAHLNLSEGRPSAPAAEVPLLLGSLGKELGLGFGDLLTLWARAGAGKRADFLTQVEREWRAQIACVRAAIAPRTLDCLDGHIHVQMLPFLFPVVAKLAAELGVPAVRISEEPFYRGGGAILAARAATDAAVFAAGAAKNLLLRAFARKAKREADRLGLRYADQVVGVLYSGRMSSARAWRGIQAARRAGAREVEVIFHVGHARADEQQRWQGAPGLAAFPSSTERQRELAELRLLNARLPRSERSRGWRLSP